MCEGLRTADVCCEFIELGQSRLVILGGAAKLGRAKAWLPIDWPDSDGGRVRPRAVFAD
jgi:hypothetical protein